MENKQATEREVYISLQYFRLQKEREMVAARKKEHEDSIKTTAEDWRIITKAKNAYHQKRSESKDGTLRALDEVIKSFENRHEGENFRLNEDGRLKEILKAVYKEDKYGLARTLLAMSLILDPVYPFHYEEEGYEALSDLLFDNIWEVGFIKERLEDDFSKIARKDLTPTQWGCLIALAASVTVLVPLVSAAGIAASTGAVAAVDAGALALGGILAGGAVLGLGTLAIEHSNIKEAKREFRKLNYEESALFLAMETVLIDRARKNLPKEEFKEEINSILEKVDALKSDTSYLLFVEKANPETNKEKIKAFHRFDNHLVKVMGI